MAINSVTINRDAFGLGTSPENLDKVSGIIFFDDNLPSGFDTSNNIKKIYSLEEAENLGIVNTHTDETLATDGVCQIIATAATSSVWSLKVDDGKIASYTQVSGDDEDAIATGLNTALNLLTGEHGFTSTVSTDTITITAPAKLGLSINDSTHLSTSQTGSTLTQFTDGVGSKFATFHYHISEYFRGNINGELYVGIYPASADTSYDGAPIQDMADHSEGRIRQISVYSEQTYSSSLITSSQAYATITETNSRPLSVFVSGDMTALSIGSFTDLKTLDSKDITLSISEDANFWRTDYSDSTTYNSGDMVNYCGKYFTAIQNGVSAIYPFNIKYWKQLGINLKDVVGYSIGTTGLMLGVSSSASVQQNIGAVKDFNIASTITYFTESAFQDGTLFKNASVGTQTDLIDKSYIYIKSFTDKTGLYFIDDWTCTLRTSDFSSISNNKVINKAVRGVKVNLLPLLNGDLYLNEDGTLSLVTLNVYLNAAKKALESMKVAGEISQFEVIIDSTQPVLLTNNINVSIKIVPVGKSRFITVDIKFATNL